MKKHAWIIFVAAAVLLSWQVDNQPLLAVPYDLISFLAAGFVLAWGGIGLLRLVGRRVEMDRSAWLAWIFLLVDIQLLCGLGLRLFLIWRYS
jgi:hypothetical protein